MLAMNRFNIMDHDVLKVYNGVRNVIFQIRAKNPPSGRRAEKDAILLASHIDSTLPSKGAAEWVYALIAAGITECYCADGKNSDALGVGVMLDIARVVIDRNRPFDNSILFGEPCITYHGIQLK